MNSSKDDFYKKGIIPKSFMPDWRYWGHVKSAYAIDLAELTVGIEPTILFSKKKKALFNELKIVLKHQDPQGKYCDIESILSRVTNLNKSINSAIKAGELNGKHNFNTNCFKINVRDYAAWLKIKNIKSPDELKKYYKPAPTIEEKPSSDTVDNIKYNRQIIAALLERLRDTQEYKKYSQNDIALELDKNCHYVTIGDSSIDKIFAEANHFKK